MRAFLLVKTSSMGDVIHNLPVVADIAARFPGAVLDWVVEEGFAEIPRLHPGVRRVVTVAVRRWRRNPLSAATRAEWSAFRARLAEQGYDRVIDTQGLIKSALLARLARGPRSGHGFGSARESLAALGYHQRHRIDRTLHAVDRNRLLAGAALGYSPEGPPRFGLAPAPARFSWLPSGPYAVLIHATSRDSKLWPEEHWLALAGHLAGRGLALILPWGDEAERRRAERLSLAMPGALVAPRLPLASHAAVFAGARAVVGVDTGLAHLAAAVGVPTVGVYCTTEPGLTGIYPAPHTANVGSAAGAPPVAQVAEALARVAGL